MTSPRTAHRVVTTALVPLTVTLALVAAPQRVVAESRPPITTTTTMVVPGTPDEVFDLFTPERRSVWDPEWKIEINTPGKEQRDGPGAVFHSMKQPETISTVLTLDAQQRVIEIESARPGFYDLAVRIACSEADAGQTSVDVTYTAVAHSDHIHEAIESSLAHQIDNVVVGKEGWRDTLTHYLTHGTRFTPFQPVAIERSHTIQFDASPDQVFAIVDPASGNHWTPSTPEYVFGSADEPSGAMWRRRDSWYLVADHDPADHSMKTVLFIPETEFLLEELRCDAGPEGGTTMTITWRVAGLPPDGNEAVQSFFDNHWDRRMASLEETYRIRLDSNGDTQ